MKKGDATPAFGLDRRTLIKTGTLAAGSLLATSVLTAQEPKTSPPSSRFRFAFLPCIHFRFDLNSPQGLAACLAAVDRLDPKPDFLLTGGDVCHNLRDESLDGSRQRVARFKEVWSAGTKIPTHHCLGNHDLAAWNDPQAAADPDYGKSLLVKQLGLPGTYYSFDHGGWHFVVLDYLKQEAPGRFSPELDAKQLDWLRGDLHAAGSRPTILVDHAPFLSAYEAYTDRGIETDKGRTVPYGRVVKNLPEVEKLLADSGANVRGLLSGHLHILEEIVWRGRRFICCGSVSGQQWNGPRFGCPEGFGVFDCKPDGTFDFAYQPYGWKAG
jgi:3',5'-cyclic AMP phosphodiesterase CpdA